MAAKSVAMEQLKQVLNLYRDGQSIKGIVRLTGLSRNTVRAYLAKLTEEVEHKPTQSDAALAGIFYNQDRILRLIKAYATSSCWLILKMLIGSCQDRV